MKPILSVYLWLLSTSSVLAAFNCEFVVDKNIKYDLTSLRGPHSVSVMEDTPPTKKNTTWTIDPCAPLKIYDDIPSDNQCPLGTQVCGIVTRTRHSTHPSDTTSLYTEPEEVIPIAGDIGNNLVEGKITRFTKADLGGERLRIELHGGEWRGKKQTAVIEFICDLEKTGWEGQEHLPAAPEMKMNEKRADGNDTSGDDKSLKFESYNGETLQLTWRTKHACESTEKNGESKGGKGFFTWFIIIVFMVIASYLIFGSWLNYNRYGARGWDLLPHSDTMRDLPYLFRDFLRRIVNTFNGGNGSRGGYSAV